MKEKYIVGTRNSAVLVYLGWLVWSDRIYGCGVVYRREDGKMIIVTGVQGDFCYV